jgi:hypothetical protein
MRTAPRCLRTLTSGGSQSLLTRVGPLDCGHTATSTRAIAGNIHPRHRRRRGFAQARAEVTAIAMGNGERTLAKHEGAHPLARCGERRCANADAGNEVAFPPGAVHADKPPVAGLKMPLQARR